MFRILQLAITGQFVPDGGRHVEFDCGIVAAIIADNRTQRDGITRRVVDEDDTPIITYTKDGVA